MLQLEHLGATRRLAIRKFQTEFRAHGWRDVDGAALAMVARLEKDGGRATARSVAAAAPSDFMVVNAVSRAQLTRSLEALAERTGG